MHLLSILHNSIIQYSEETSVLEDKGKRENELASIFKNILSYSTDSSSSSLVLIELIPTIITTLDSERVNGAKKSEEIIEELLNEEWKTSSLPMFSSIFTEISLSQSQV